MSEFHDDDELDQLVDRADLDGLVRLIDARCSTRDWDGLVRVRARCQAATKTGRQVWPAATLAEYRTALLAPADRAHLMLDEDSGRFTIGPLTEVIAQNHSWSELEPFLEPGPRTLFVAHERVLRGDSPTVSDASRFGFDLPLFLTDWEPSYPVPTYSDDGVDAPCPTDRWRHEWSHVDSATEVTSIDDADVTAALRALLEPWTSSSNGRAESVGVEGNATHALRALGMNGARLSSIDAREAVAWLAWCGASGGAHGRRRGGALGRFGAWWMLAALGGITDEWDELADAHDLADEIGAISESLQWFRFDDATTSGYELSLIAVDPIDGLAFGLLARDTA